MTAETAERYPVLTFSAGKANSIRGASSLTGLRDGIVIDVGGTTTEIGALAHGFPRDLDGPALVGGVRTNLRMPDVRSLAFGGGSIVTPDPWRVGPQPVDSDLEVRALVFGGDAVTLTDIAVAAGLASIGNPELAAPLSRDAPLALEHIGATVRRAVERARRGTAHAPVIIVGGGAPLLRTLLPGFDVIMPEHHAAANAVGAATAPVSGYVDRIVSLEGVSRQEIIARAVSDAVAHAVMAGADARTIRVIATDDAPLAYLPGNLTRVRVKAVGELAVEAVYE